ncbi:hypothetical protein [Streptomyces sp. DW26H14]|uniref:hypothetical protein n=1 Tax=Streptomyces sp. DW26H14 TaxID=3435395 RepID=UPI00403D9F4F
MRRTRTTTMLLLGAAGVAATAVSGCVSVSPDGPPGAPRPGAAAAQRSGQDVRPQIVQAPLREALNIAQPPSPSTASPPTTGGRTAQQTAPGTAEPRPRDPAPARNPRARLFGSTRGEGGVHGQGYGQSGGQGARHPAPHALPSSAAGVCALGETYGHWSPGSPQARICHEAYGH